jgi:hypothetical protein
MRETFMLPVKRQEKRKKEERRSERRCALSVRLIGRHANPWLRVHGLQIDLVPGEKTSRMKRSCGLGSGRKPGERRREIVLNCHLIVGALDWNTCDPWLRMHGLQMDLAWFQGRRRAA